MIIFYPGLYVLGSALFLLSFFVVKRDVNNFNKRNNEKLSVQNPVYNENRSHAGIEIDED